MASFNTTVKQMTKML